jgi:LssY-like putative type I secretion system component LssY
MQIRTHHIKWGALLLSSGGTIVGLYFLLAYIVLPLTWRHYEHQHALEGLAMVTRTASGIPGDPINVGLVGSRDDVLCAMTAAGWYPADPITLRSSVEIAGSVLLDRPYHAAPVSHLYYNGKRQDLAFEKPAGTSADRRHHVRFWRALEHGEEGRVVWLGAVTFDRGVGFSHDDARVTHHIGPDIDAERDTLSADLKAARMVQTIYEVAGIGPTVAGHNGEGDPYYTDGDIKISVLVADCHRQTENVTVLDNPPLVTMKNLAWDTLARNLLSEAMSNAKK